MKNPWFPRTCFLTLILLMGPGPAFGHFLWIRIEPGEQTNVQAFLNETPDPAGPEFLKYVQKIRLSVAGHPLPSTLGDETLQARWVGPLRSTIDTESDLGLKSRDGKSYRLRYTARAQTVASAPSDREKGTGLQARWVVRDGRGLVQVLFDGKPVGKARIKLYPKTGETVELAADDQGLAAVEGLGDGKVALWASWVEPKAGELNGKPYQETRHYATLTVEPALAKSPPTSAPTIPELPSPAVNSFGGAVLGDWLYVYSGHVGRTHHYNVETTAKHFRRFNMRSGKTWEDLPIDQDLQGVALVADDRYVYRVGGMSAKNKPGEPEDLYSVADFARFDPESRTWTKLAALPVPRSTHDAVVIGKTLYVAGGWNMKGKNEGTEFLDDALAFSLDAPEKGWQTIPQPFKRRALSVGESQGKLYVLGGLTDGSKVEKRVDFFDPADRTWKRGPDLPGEAKAEGFGTSAFSVEGRLYYSGASGWIFRLNEGATAWEVVGAWSQPRITHRLLPGLDHQLLAVGGNHAGKQTALIESARFSRPARTTGASKAD